MNSSCDIGNPVYSRSAMAKRSGNGIVNVAFFFTEDSFEVYAVAYEWMETPEGIEVNASVPVFAVQPNDLITDVTLALEEEFNQGISRINFLN